MRSFWEAVSHFLARTLPLWIRPEVASRLSQSAVSLLRARVLTPGTRGYKEASLYPCYPCWNIGMKARGGAGEGDGGAE